MELTFYRCETCGNIAVKVTDSGVPLVCCGEEMGKLTANTNDEAATEKHVPIAEINDNKIKVRVGEVDHPMIEQHFIEWIVITTMTSWQLKHLNPNDQPEAEFEVVNGEKITAVYEYCNLHGLWKARI